MKLFWLILISSTLIWYIVATFVVAIRGVKDIRTLLGRGRGRGKADG